MNKFLMLIVCMILSVRAFAGHFTLTSTDLKSGELITNSLVLNGFGCKGNNISPELSWKDAPINTKSFAITMYDPDAPTGSGWWHWVIFNIPAEANHLTSNAGNPQSGKLPSGAIQSQTDFGTVGYGGPCPPLGDKAHRYIVTIYALKKMLSLDSKSPAAMVGYYIQQNKISAAFLTGFYHR